MAACTVTAGCTGQIVDGFCDQCGMQPAGGAPTTQDTGPTPQSASTRTGSARTGSARTGSTQLSGKSQRGSRRTSKASRLSSTRRLGLGLVQIPEVAKADPMLSLMAEAKVPESKRFCTGVKADGNACDTALTKEKCTKCGHAHEYSGTPRKACSKCGGPCEVVSREKGFCNACGTPYDFRPKLAAGDVVAGQYETCGCVAFGGMGWLYLAKDVTLNRYVLLKGLINTSDPSLAKAAIAERQFLAAVKHPNIVGVYTCVSDTREIDGKAQTHAYTVMEFISGKTLKALRKDRGPLPVTEALAYMYPVLEAFGYMHAQGLIYNDFKPDNVMLEEGAIKVIDLGGVCRATQADGDIYSTVGYAAPELADKGPSPASDLYSIGRTLAVLITEFKGFQSSHKHQLRSAVEEPVFEKHDSLYRLLLKACHDDPNMRYQSADEMAEQLVGVMREIVAVETATAHPAESRLFGPDTLGFRTLDEVTGPDVLDIHSLPHLKMDPSDPATPYLLGNLRGGDPRAHGPVLMNALSNFRASIEVRLAAANNAIECGAIAAAEGQDSTRIDCVIRAKAAEDYFTKAEGLLVEVEEIDAFDWRVIWYRGVSFLAQQDYKQALDAFETCYREVPGELAVKLAIAIAAERNGDTARAIKYYDVVSRTNPDFATAAFGLSRCLAGVGKRDEAVAALSRIPQTSNLYGQAQKTTAQTLIRPMPGSFPGAQELVKAGSTIEALMLEGIEKFKLLRDVFVSALSQIDRGHVKPDPSVTVLGHQLDDTNIRLGLEHAYRNLARLSPDRDKRIELVDLANRVRPRTLL
jgi:serine/threonine-protein kinase PknG